MADTGDAEMKDAEPQQNGTENGTDSANNDDRKLFVGRLSWETTDKELKEHFGQYGEIESVSVKTDSSTGRSRGFAFIVFKDPESIEKVMAAEEHVVNNKKVDPKKAKARHGKIFVGGLDPETSEEDIRAYFGQYGTVIEVELPFDKTKSQRKKFCFITFESEQVANDLLKKPKLRINGKEVDVKKPNPKAAEGRGGLGGRGGRGRGGPGRRGQGGWGGQGGYGGNYSGGYGGYGGNYGYDGYYNGGGYAGGYGGYDYSGYGQGYNQGYGGGGGYDGYGYGSGYDGGYGGGGGGGGGGGRGRGKVVVMQNGAEPIDTYEQPAADLGHTPTKSGFGGGKQRGGRSQRPAPY